MLNLRVKCTHGIKKEKKVYGVCDILLGAFALWRKSTENIIGFVNKFPKRKEKRKDDRFNSACLGSLSRLPMFIGRG